MHTSYILKQLRNADPARQHGHIGHEAHIAHKPVALGPGIAPEYSELSLIGRKSENRIQRRGLARAVGTNQPENPSFFHAQVHAVQCDGCAEGLAQTSCLYACHGFSGPPWWTRASSIRWASASRN